MLSFVMKGELFVPILPIMALAELPKAIAVIGARPKPLALHLFRRNRASSYSTEFRTDSRAKPSHMAPDFQWETRSPRSRMPRRALARPASRK